MTGSAIGWESMVQAVEWFTIPIDEVASRLSVSVETGLTSAEAARRLAEHGRNVLDSGRGRSRIAAFLDQFRSVMIWILAAA
ncbi:hypothetical protein HQ535_13095, partial [bacterium]|nr:hypothetical protein [bacterium]